MIAVLASVWQGQVESFQDFYDVFWFGCPNNIRRCYDRINEFLTANVTTDDVEVNMNAIREWHTAMLRDLDSESGILDPHDQKMSKALSQLEALSHNDGPDLCTSSTYAALSNNDKATRGILRKLKPGELPERRIDKIVYHYAMKYAQECSDYHLQSFKSSYQNIKKEYLFHVKSFIGSILRRHLENKKNLLGFYDSKNADMFMRQKSFKTSQFAKSMRSVKSEGDAEVANRLLSVFAKNRFSTGLDADEKGYKIRAYEKLFVKPCENFVENFHDAFSHTPTIINEVEPQNVDPEKAEFYENLAYYHGCNTFLRDQVELFQRMLKMTNLKTKLY